MFHGLGKNLGEKLAGGSNAKAILAKVGLSTAIGLGKFISTDGTQRLPLNTGFAVHPG